MKKLFSAKYRQRTLAIGITLLLYVIVNILTAAGSLSRMLVSLTVPVCCYLVAAIGLNLEVGVSGELNLGQAGFMAVGGFSAAVFSGMLEESVTNDGLRLAICIVLGAAIAGLFGWLISVPVLKLQGDYLAIVTLAFGQIIMTIFNNLYVGYDKSGLHFAFVNDTMDLDPETGVELISGPMGATGIHRASTFTAGVILVIIALLLVYNLIYSRTGRAIMACRDNRIAAETIGINVAHTKTIAFVLSSALAGAAGALYMLNYASVSASKFDYNNSIMILVYVVLGGLGNFAGTVVSTTVLVVLPEILRFLSTYRMLIYAIVLIVIMLVTNNEHVRTAVEKFRKKRTLKEAGDND